MKAVFAVLTVLAFATACGDARTRIEIVGSSTVFPFASIVAEQFSALTEFETPKVEANGTGGGIAIFCQDSSILSPEIANASRRIKKSEFETCEKAGVNGIIELKIGYDGIVIASAKTGQTLNFSRKQIFLALAKQLPIDGKLVANPYRYWNEIDPSLPHILIDVMGPPPTSGTRDAFVELVMEKGAAEIPYFEDIHKSDKDRFKELATSIREDGVWKDMGENDNLIVQALVRNPDQFGVFGYAFFEENADRIKVANIDRIAPTVENISSGQYSASRSLYIYAKQQHIGMIPGLQEYLLEFVSKRAAGINGYLGERGMIPLPETERAHSARIAQNLIIMSRPEK
jgi:phosphate transport system substrate-binding protein